MQRLLLAVLLLAVLSPAARAGKKATFHNGQLIDFTERTYTEYFLGEGSTCKEWLYTVEGARYTFVASKSTCYPGWVGPLRVVVNQSIRFGLKRSSKGYEELGLFNRKGKIRWFKIKKVTANTGRKR